MKIKHNCKECAKKEIREWKRIWGLIIPLGAEEDLIKRIEISNEN